MLLGSVNSSRPSRRSSVTNSRLTLMGIFAAVSVAAFALSQLSSYLVNSHIPQGDTVVVNSFLHLTHIRNLGGVFGIFQGKGWVFAIISSLLILALTLYLLKSRHVRPYEFICFGFIAGGGASNVMDRLVYGSVVDFINVQQIPYWHYIFNTADVMVHIGLWPMLFISLFASRNNDQSPA